MNKPRIAFAIEEKLIKSYDVFGCKIFGNVEEFYKLESFGSTWISDAGISADCPIGKVQFQQLYNECDGAEIVNRLLYYYDCDNLVSSLQNVINESFYLKDRIERILSEEIRIDNTGSNFTGYKFLTGDVVVELFSFINMLFFNLYSQLDYMTKLCFELNYTCSDFSTYPKMRSTKVVYGDKKDIKIYNVLNTLFEADSHVIKMIINFRSEIIHNGTLDSNQRLFQKYENGKIVEQFILLPDTKDGNLEKFKSRSHFYGAENKWQNIIPPLLDEYYIRLLNTLQLMLLKEGEEEFEFTGLEMKLLAQIFKVAKKPDDLTVEEWEDFRKKFGPV